MAGLIYRYSDTACTQPISIEYSISAAGCSGVTLASGACIPTFAGQAAITKCQSEEDDFAAAATNFLTGGAVDTLFAETAVYSSDNCSGGGGTGSVVEYVASLLDACIAVSNTTAYRFSAVNYSAFIGSDIGCVGSAAVVVANSAACSAISGGGSFQLINYGFDSSSFSSTTAVAATSAAPGSITSTFVPVFIVIGIVLIGLAFVTVCLLFRLSKQPSVSHPFFYHRENKDFPDEVEYDTEELHKMSSKKTSEN
ncbi:hypothetical protein HK100_005332 [Physocladia obscura]|uniref:Uncharacterized protein n=1 Tax=Physocladia obscura TaxID=109957 RepID=A0AAD5XIV6_9FUNG|nr:hypothetical protein HK100_005332 [Physocladia obscura]